MKPTVIECYLHYIRWTLFIFIFSVLVPCSFSVHSSQGADDPGFLLGPGDLLEISVWKDQELTRQVVVQPDGFISFPLLGEIKAAGRTIPKIRNELAARLSDYMSSPIVTVSPVKIESYRVYVIGKVNKPGIFVVLPSVTVLQALSMAGGTTPFADLGDIVIIRHGTHGEKKIDFNYDEVAVGEKLEQNIELQSGDVVLVP